ncbi:MAG: hypothetical protein IPN18_19980 [Ignavibacteriales bacterium]|nr:hypothetical protein [Ignavibacteriales bacterium]
MIFNIILNVLSIYFLYVTILLFASNSIARLTAIWMAFDIQTIGFSLSLLSDVPANISVNFGILFRGQISNSRN